MEREKYFIEEAIKIAVSNVKSGNGGPFGAVIVRGDEIIAAKGNSVSSTNDPTAHAEINTIREACKKLGTFEFRDCDIFVSGEPCPMCMSAIYWARLKNVYYAADRESAKKVGFDDSYIYEQLAQAVEDRDIPIIRVPVDDEELPFQEWVKYENKIEY